MKPCTIHRTYENSQTVKAQTRSTGVNRKFMAIFLFFPLLLLMGGCTPFWKFYDFKGAAIPADIQTFSVDFFSNEAAIVNPQLSMSFTEKLKTKFQSETRLSLTNADGDYKFGGSIVEYSITPAALNADVGTAQNQFNIKVRVEFVCEKYPEKSFARDFSFFKIFDASATFESVEESLSTEIQNQIVQQIFAAVALDW
ncbi:MAG: hypothetical protein FJ333_09905 [Sphingomonadales bacterium]|nr:hypothetical protein [Sphingomonadales bacterium]